VLWTGIENLKRSRGSVATSDVGSMARLMVGREGVYPRSSRAPNTQAWPLRLCRVIPSTCPLRIICVRLDSLDHSPGRRCSPRPLHGPKSSLNVAVVRFDSVVTVSSGALPTIEMQLAFALPNIPAGMLSSAFWGVRQRLELVFEGRGLYLC
jgi:hypothetical protein